jgi:hypothetical protein
MARVKQADSGGVALGTRRTWLGFLAERSPIRVSREVLSPTFQGSRAELERATALRLQAAVVLLLLAVRSVHLGQAGVDLALAGRAYTVQWLAVLLGVACMAESVVVAGWTLGARRLTPRAMLADAAFGVAGLAVMAVATSSGPGRAGSLNWMLPYTVATATGLGVLAGGDLVDAAARVASPSDHDRGGPPVRRRLWPLVAAVGLGGAYVASAYLPNRLAYDSPGQIWGDAANYIVFFVAGALTLRVSRRGVMAMSARNAEVAAAAAEVEREARSRVISVDVFGPVIALLDRIVDLPDGEFPLSARHEADRLISLIDAVRPADVGGLRSEAGAGRVAR